MLDTLWQDVRYAVRTFARAPMFAFAAVLTLALGIGANAAMFSVADATALRPPDVPRPDELVRLFTSSVDTPYGEVSYPDYLDFRARTKSLAGLVAYEHADFALAKGRDDVSRYLGGWVVSGNFFSVLGVEPTLGRGFRADEENVSTHVAVISHRLWERDFQRNAAIVGTRVLLSGHEFTIVGVAPERFSGTELYFQPDIFVPLSAIASVAPGSATDALENRSRRWLTVLGRLRSDANAAQAASEFAVLAKTLEGAYPDANRGRTAAALPELTARARLDAGGMQGAVVIMALVGLVVLLACANVANLMLSRAVTRTREMALRLALGATRTRLVCQLLTESILLATAGGAVGLLIATWSLNYLSTVLVIPSALPLVVDLRLDDRVLTFTGLTSMLTALLFGLTPALQSTRYALNAWLTRTTDTRPGRPRLSLRTGLVVLQVALSVVTLVSSGLMIRAFITAQRVDPGFRADRVLIASFNPTLARYDANEARRFYDAVLERISSLSGVAAAGLTRFVPLGVTGGSVSLVVDGFQMPEGQDRFVVAETVVDPGYWEVMRTPIVRGRPFDQRDTSSSTRVAIVNETMAREYWPNQDALGKTIRIPDQSGPQVQVVGVARDGKYSTLAEAPQPFIYRPFSQGRRLAMTMVVLAKADPSALASEIRGAVKAVDPAVPMFDVRTMDDLYRSRALLPSRVMSQMVTALGVLALLLVSVGLYGVMAFLAARRTQEVGIRMAVGATPRSVLALVLRQAATLVLPGLALGLVIASLLTPLIGSPAFDFVRSRDPLVFAIVTLVIATVATAASAIPAVRAARIDPTVALRVE